MLIDNATAVLVAVAIASTPNDDGRYWAEFYPVDRILALRDNDDFLRGHPLLDIEPSDVPDVAGELLRPGLAHRLTRWTQAGRFVALKRNARKGGVLFSWRKGEDYLSEEERFWLGVVSESAEFAVAELRAAKVLAALFQHLYPLALTRAKRQRRAERRERKRERKRGKKNSERDRS